MAAWRSFNCASKVSVSPAVTTAIHKIGSRLATVLNSQRDKMTVFDGGTCRYFLPEPIKCVYPKCFVLHGFGWACPFLIPGGLLSHRVKSALACSDCDRQKSCRVAPKKSWSFCTSTKCGEGALILWQPRLKSGVHAHVYWCEMRGGNAGGGEYGLSGALAEVWRNRGGKGIKKNIYMHLQKITWISQINKKNLSWPYWLSGLKVFTQQKLLLYMSDICFSERTKDCLHQLTLIGFASSLMIFIWLFDDQCHRFDSCSSDDN